MVGFGYFLKYLLNCSPRVIDDRKPIGKSFSYDFVRIHQISVETAKMSEFLQNDNFSDIDSIDL